MLWDHLSQQVALSLSAMPPKNGLDAKILTIINESRNVVLEATLQPHWNSMKYLRIRDNTDFLPLINTYYLHLHLTLTNTEEAKVMKLYKHVRQSKPWYKVITSHTCNSQQNGSTRYRSNAVGRQAFVYIFITLITWSLDNPPNT